MKKKISILLVIMVVLGMLAACGKKDEKVLMMGTNAEFPPYEFYEGEDIVGIDVDLVKAIADKLEMEFDIADMDFNAIIPAVQSGKVTIGAAGMTITEERMKEVAFTDTYYTGRQVIIVREESEKMIQRLQDQMIWKARKSEYNWEQQVIFMHRMITAMIISKDLTKEWKRYNL